jgi:TnpA family transposase
VARGREVAQQKRLNILDDHEIDDLYGLPRFTSDERQLYFTLTGAEQAVCRRLRSLPSQVSFILQLGYFKARQQFFTFTFAEVADDVAAVLARHVPADSPVSSVTPTPPTLANQRDIILELFGYRMCRVAERQQLFERAQQLARLSTKPIYLFRELLHYLAHHRIVAPAYTVMQDLIGKALSGEQQRVSDILHAQLSPADIAALDQLIAETDGLYLVTQLKHEPSDFGLKVMRAEVHRGDTLRPLYHLAMRVVPRLKISPDAVAYYASLVGYYSTHRLQELDRWLAYLYLLCFVIHRFHRFHDHVLTTLIHKATSFVAEATEKAKEKAGDQRLERSADLVKAGSVLQLIVDDAPSPTTTFTQMQAQAFKLLDRERLARVAAYLSTNAPVDELALQWAELDEAHKRWKQHLRHLLGAVELSATRRDESLLEAVQFLLGAVASGRPLKDLDHQSFPVRWIPVRLKRYLYQEDADGAKRLNADRYEFLIYQQVCKGLEAGNIVCRASVQFRSLADDLLSDEQWREKERILAALNLPGLRQPIREQLAALAEQLEARIQEVNGRIANGENADVRVSRRGEHQRWTLTYPEGSEPVNDPLFDTVPQVDLRQVLAFAEAGCTMLSAFSHMLSRYQKQRPEPAVLYACLMAMGTNMGLGRMGEISDLPTHVLMRASENYLRPETLRAANDMVCNAIAALPIARHYDLNGLVHSSSDGQKFETAIPTFNARHARKYFGLRKGIVANTLVAGNIPVNAQVIGAHDHESHYVLDLLLNNTTTVQPAIHSTDTHGTNELNFALLHVFGYQFAPRYRQIQKKIRTSLCGFQHPKQYEGLLLRPTRKLNIELIISEWDNLLRIFASLALKTTPQSIIVRKLSSYGHQNRTKRALLEFDSIFRSLHLLEFVDSPPLRQNVQRALNRGENYHQLRKAIAYANFGKLRYRTEEEQVLWSECSRLLANCVIYYNAAILSRVLEERRAAGDLAGVEQLTQVAPVAWQHINFYGRYEFTSRVAPIDLERVVAALLQSTSSGSGTEQVA